MQNQVTTISNGSRRSLAEQAQAIYTVLTDVYENSPWSLEQIQADLRQDNTHYLFAEQEGQVVGFLAWQDLLGECELTNLAVKKARQGQGVARKLLKGLPLAETSFFLEVRQSNLVAQKLYQSMGFIEIGRRNNYYHQPVEDAIIMKCE